VATGVLIVGHQVRGQRGAGLGPGRHVRAPAALPLVVVGHPPFLPAEDLHIGGVQINRHRLAQRRNPPCRQRGEHRGVNVPDPGLHRAPLPVGQPPGQPRRGSRAQPRHRREHLTSDIGSLAIQPDEKVLPDQLRGRHPDQQLPTRMPTVAGLDRPDRSVQQLDHVQAVDQLSQASFIYHDVAWQDANSDSNPKPSATTVALERSASYRTWRAVFACWQQAAAPGCGEPLLGPGRSHGDPLGEADRETGSFTVRLPRLLPRPELGKHRPGRQLPAFVGSVGPPISGGRRHPDAPPLTVHCVDHLPITSSNRSVMDGRL
jgi:hypothetical protein